MASPPAGRQRPKLRGPDTAKYEVGHGKPPVETRFKPGGTAQEHHPRGGLSRHPHQRRDKQIKVPMAQAIVRAVAVNAVKGQQRGQRLLTEMLTTTERENKALHDAWMDAALTYKIEWDRELERRLRFGITDLPDPLPHPDRIVLDMRAGTVRVAGPP